MGLYGPTGCCTALIAFATTWVAHWCVFQLPALQENDFSWVKRMVIDIHVSLSSNPCDHAQTIGDIEDVNGHKCVICPWHKYPISLTTGEGLYKAAKFMDGKLQPGEWKSKGQKHRIHTVEERDDGMYVQASFFC